MIPGPGVLLRRHGLRPRKAWGQNFLHDRRVAAKIVDEVPTGPPVVEIGAGLGALSAPLLERGHVLHAVERDRDLAAVLRAELGSHPAFTIHEADAVGFDYGAVASGDIRPTVVGNLPYHLTGPLLFRLLEHHAGTGPWIVMVQKEVGDRLLASPGGRTYGAATVSIGRVRRVRRVCKVPRGAFLPPPRVDSVVLSVEPRPVPLSPVPDPAAFVAFVRRLFQGRRKRIANALSFAGGRDQVAAALAACNIDPGLRCECLPIEDLARLACALSAGTPDA